MTVAPTPCEVALRARLALLNAKRAGRPVPEDELLASVVGAGYPRELAVAALAIVRSRNEAYLAKDGWLPGAPPVAGRSGEALVLGREARGKAPQP